MCAMPSWLRERCPRKTFLMCAISSLVLLVGLLVFVVLYLISKRHKIVGENLIYDPSDNPDCGAEPTVVADAAVIKRWNPNTNFSQTLSEAEQRVKEPAHKYMEKPHVIAIYIYTKTALRPADHEKEMKAEGSPGERETSEYRFLVSSLSEAIQVLKHSQVTCLDTSYRTDSLFNLNASNEKIRFSSFITGSYEKNMTRSTSCFEIHTCFGADITYYSALKRDSQVLIPPYELFTLIDTQTDTLGCSVVYTLRSDLNCVYDSGRNMLHPISASPTEGFQYVFIITCVIVVCLLVPYVIVKVLKCCEKTAVRGVSSVCDTPHYRAGVVIQE
ncbi:uncharacterized protein ACBR49_000957 isoform 2-T2 [Aulostomus maculatus]